MTRKRAAVAAFCAAATMGAAAHAAEPARVVIAGPRKDPVAARLERELVALGFAPVMVGPLESCARAAVEAAVSAAEASAALCSDGEAVGVWTPKGAGRPIELRDVVAPQERGSHGLHEVAMRAAEVMRASVALRDTEEPETEPEPEPAPRPPMATGGWEELEKAEKPEAASPLSRRTAAFTFGAGASMLTSTDATTTGLSLHGAFGLHRSFALTAHVDAPVGSAIIPNGVATTDRVRDSSERRVAPGIAGVGIELPLAGPSARFIPRVGGALGVAWLHASRKAGSSFTADGAEIASQGASATVFAPAGWATASLSTRIYGPVRCVIEGLVGTAAGRLMVRDQGIVRAHWGTPIGGLALRAEILIP